MSDILIAYYSFSGTTQSMAQAIARQTGGELRALIPETPYAFHYNTAAREARSQIQRGFCPALAQGNAPIEGYHTVFIGSPNWFKSLAPPVLSFLRQHDFSGKDVVPFCTHGGGGFGEMEAILAKECPGARIRAGLAAYGEATPQALTDWLTAFAQEERNAGKT